jgi:glutamyl-tRNA reductase
VDRLVCLGLSHRTAPVELRERFGTLGLGAERCPEVVEHVVLSTCYRVELYALLADGVDDARNALVDALAELHGIELEMLVEHLYVHGGVDAARHLSRVAAGLDSLVLGEAEILGQVRDALERSGTTAGGGGTLSLLFRTAITAGRRTRAETAIGANPGTASSMAIALAEGVLGNLVDRRALVVGAGQIGTQTLRALQARGISNLAVVNRTKVRATEAAVESGAVAYGLAELEEALAWADFVPAATGSEVPVVDGALVRAAIGGRSERPLVLVDLAVPSDVAREVAAIDGVSLFDVDDLRAGLDGALAARLREVPHVERIVEEEIEAFERRYRELQVEPLVAELRLRAETIRKQELERALDRAGGVDRAAAEELERLSRALVAKLLHEPTARLRERAGEGDADGIASALRELFGLATPREP